MRIIDKEQSNTQMETRVMSRYNIYLASFFSYFLASFFFSLYIYKSIPHLLFFMYIALALYTLYMAYDYIKLSLADMALKRISKKKKEIKRQVVKGEISDIDFQREEAILDNKEIKANINRLKASIELKYLSSLKLFKFFLAKSYIDAIINTPLSQKEVTREEVMRQLLINSKRTKTKGKTKKTITSSHIDEIKALIKEILLPKAHEYEKIKKNSFKAKLERIRNKNKH